MGHLYEVWKVYEHPRGHEGHLFEVSEVYGYTPGGHMRFGKCMCTLWGHSGSYLRGTGDSWALKHVWL